MTKTMYSLYCMCCMYSITCMLYLTLLGFSNACNSSLLSSVIKKKIQHPIIVITMTVFYRYYDYIYSKLSVEFTRAVQPCLRWWQPSFKTHHTSSFSNWPLYFDSLGNSCIKILTNTLSLGPQPTDRLGISLNNEIWHRFWTFHAFCLEKQKNEYRQRCELSFFFKKVV